MMNLRDRLLGLWRRCENCRMIRAFQWTRKGSARARAWPDSTLEGANGNSSHGTDSCDSPNPLRMYFDAITDGRGIWKWDHYFDIYHRHFQRFVGKEVRLLEVGIYSGGSLDMWKAYFGPKCVVYGVDVEEACKAYEDESTKVFIGDQSDRHFWRRVRDQAPIVDILIDDGGHAPEQQTVTLEGMLPHLRPGGVYLCEDIHGKHNRFAAYVFGLTDALNENRQIAEFASASSALQKSIYSVHSYPFVTVIEKAQSPVPEFVSLKRGTKWQPFKLR
jgi:hypothetical protein